jgi:ubiquinone/menaquinone biosynthesis C-methylase UbiE
VTSSTSIIPAVQGAPALYNRIAPLYDALHQHWLWLGGAQAVAAIEGCVAGDLRPGCRVLDAGCGTGALARRLVAIEPACDLTLVDAAPRMLARAADLPGRHVLADLRALPFADASFDIVMSTWALETLGEERAFALVELIRVLKPGGILCYCVCSWPASPSLLLRARTIVTRLAIKWFFYGRFLLPGDFLTPRRGTTRRLVFHDGLSTVVIHRKARNDTGEHDVR